jgi:hypothetical protein
VAFGSSLALIYAVALAVVPRLAHLDNRAVIAGALTIDLTLLVPLLYYVLLVRPRGWPAISIVPVFLISVLIAEPLIPKAQHQVLDLVSYGAVLAELALVAVIAYKALQLRKGFRDGHLREASRKRASGGGFGRGRGPGLRDCRPVLRHRRMDPLSGDR